MLRSRCRNSASISSRRSWSSAVNSSRCRSRPADALLHRFSTRRVTVSPTCSTLLARTLDASRANLSTARSSSRASRRAASSRAVLTIVVSNSCAAASAYRVSLRGVRSSVPTCRCSTSRGSPGRAIALRLLEVDPLPELALARLQPLGSARGARAAVGGVGLELGARAPAAGSRGARWELLSQVGAGRAWALRRRLEPLGLGVDAGLDLLGVSCPVARRAVRTRRSGPAADGRGRRPSSATRSSTGAASRRAGPPRFEPASASRSRDSRRAPRRAGAPAPRAGRGVGAGAGEQALEGGGARRRLRATTPASAAGEAELGVDVRAAAGATAGETSRAARDGGARGEGGGGERDERGQPARRPARASAHLAPGGCSAAPSGRAGRRGARTGVESARWARLGAREGGREQRLGAQRLGGGEVRGQHRKRAQASANQRSVWSARRRARGCTRGRGARPRRRTRAARASTRAPRRPRSPPRRRARRRRARRGRARDPRPQRPAVAARRARAPRRPARARTRRASEQAVRVDSGASAAPTAT